MNKKKNTVSSNGNRPRVLFLPFYRDQRMLDGVYQFAQESGWVLDSLYFHRQKLPSSWEGDGILCMLPAREEEPSISDFVQRHAHVPTVDLSESDLSVDLPRVLQGNAAIGQIGAEHLVSRGCQRLGFATHGHNSFHDERYRGFCEKAEALGHEVVLLHIPYEYYTGAQNDLNWFTQHLEGVEFPIGIMAAADYLTQWVVQACDALGLSIPDQVATLGVDNCREICELSAIGITSVDNNAFGQGYEGARLLEELMAGKTAPPVKRVIPPGALYVRASTDIMATRHPHVATALNCIEERFADPALSPKDVADLVPMSERRLHDAFIKYVGRSVHQEITRLRLQKAVSLIRNTNNKLWVIAEASGFSYPEHMSRLFRQRLGHPPSHYRQGASQDYGKIG
jgi:LacI family transcriptional regulator